MIRGQTRPIKDKVLSFKKDVKLNIHNRFDIEVINTKTGDVEQKAYAENIVLDTLWTRLLAPNTYFNYIHYGIGTGTPVASRTSLFTFLGAKSAPSSSLKMETNPDEGWVSFKKSCQISETEYVGSEFTEVGIGYGNQASNLVTHALLKDMNRNPISIIKEATDIINIYATVFVHWNADGYDNGSIKIFGNKTIPARLAESWLLMYFLSGCSTSCIPSTLNYCVGDPIRADGSMSPISIIKTLAWTYDLSQKKMRSTTIRLAAGEANSTTGIKSISLGGEYQYYSRTKSVPLITFDVGGTWYDESKIIGESIGTGDGVTKDFKTIFPFVKPGAKVYIDGVAQQSGVTISDGKPNIQLIDSYMKVIEIFLPEVQNGNYERIPYPGINISGSLDDNSSGGGIYLICENPFYADGILSYNASMVIVYASDDLSTWVQLSDSDDYSRLITVPAEHRTKRYWKVLTKSHYKDSCRFYNIICPTYDNFKNIQFEAPPPAGSVITADYACDLIAKDANHVFDFSIEISLTEKTA